jgi:hypothetical protein
MRLAHEGWAVSQLPDSATGADPAVVAAAFESEDDAALIDSILHQLTDLFEDDDTRVDPNWAPQGAAN